MQVAFDEVVMQVTGMRALHRDVPRRGDEQRDDDRDRERDGEPDERGGPVDREAGGEDPGEDDADQALGENREAKADAGE